MLNLPSASLHQYQNALKSQVETLAASARDVKEQLSQDNEDSSTVEVALMAPPMKVENVTDDEVMSLGVPPLKNIVKASKKVTPRKNKVEEEAPPLTVATQMKSVPKKRASSTKTQDVKQVTEINAGASAVTMEPDVSIVSAAPKEAKVVLSTLATRGGKTVKDVGKRTSTMKKKTIVVKGTPSSLKSVTSDALPVALVETKGPAATSSSVAPEWGRLSDSTLKRKTVKELIDYLELKGVAVTGEDGKKLTKDTLVNLVISG